MSAVETLPEREVALGHLTYTEVAARLAEPGRRKVAVIPVGSTEAHGPHLPLCTDSLISSAVAARAAAELERRGVVALYFPTVHYAVTDWAGEFTGSVSIAAAVAIAQVLQVCGAALAMGFEDVAVFTAHLEPDHIASLREVARQFAATHGRPLIFVDTTRRALAARLTPEYQSGSCHAGQYETSLVMALRPELVRETVAASLPGHPVPLAQRIREGARNFRECGMDQAYCGTPALASAEEGRQTLAVLSTLVVEAVLQASPSGAGA